MPKTRRDRTFTQYLSDPNPTGAFVGGPPLLSDDDMRRLMKAKDIDHRIAAAMREIQAEHQEKTESSLAGEPATSGPS